MKNSSPVFTLALISVLVLAGCNQSETKVDATVPLTQSFATAPADVQQTIQTVNTSLNSGNYVEAVKSLSPVVSEGTKLTNEQKEAVAAVVKQINQALAANPALDTKELYEQRVNLIKAVRGF